MCQQLIGGQHSICRFEQAHFDCLALFHFNHFHLWRHFSIIRKSEHCFSARAPSFIFHIWLLTEFSIAEYWIIFLIHIIYSHLESKYESFVLCCRLGEYLISGLLHDDVRPWTFVQFISRCHQQWNSVFYVANEIIGSRQRCWRIDYAQKTKRFFISLPRNNPFGCSLAPSEHQSQIVCEFPEKMMNIYQNVECSLFVKPKSSRMDDHWLNDVICLQCVSGAPAEP